MTMDLVIETRRYDAPEVVALVAAVQQEYVVRYGGPDEAAVDTDEFAPPNGLFLLGLRNGVPVATGGWRRVPDGLSAVQTSAVQTSSLEISVVEIKRMFVVSSARGRGLARLMLAELERTAQEAGADEAVLNTGDRQPEAIALYESSGYLPAEGFGHYACTPGAVFYRKRLR
jgi:GNAT superfamily N-acetyltransferase